MRKGLIIMNKISAGTIARTIILTLALINQVLAAIGKPIINISDDNINMLISSGFTVVSAIMAWWKNNSFTKEAIEADKYKNSLKN